MKKIDKEQLLYELLNVSATFAFDKQRDIRFMVCPLESPELNVIWMMKAIRFNVETPIARIRMDCPAYAEKNSNFVNPQWILNDEEIDYFNSFIRKKTNCFFSNLTSECTVFKNAILRMNIEKYYVDPDETLKLRYSDYQNRKDGPLPYDLPIPDYLKLKNQLKLYTE
ncbi:hypothetical protein SAMN02745213_00327 [Succinivibrio dextrinosolvens DSM 3072]|uniref:Uncharacterized protein n=1 Tax=Succinivibrio dextrinosolvens DSM 3072 TaxID=1123324 RepID=A0A1T4UZH2_9GAMM|nr:hypothetical protein [Succinivibrio dextrinosolvens]MBE6424191.1 hypothetical protein [Succinivibrio dextrinosolvens]SKA58045.1 hypothetical protein SAMN02745213_00327 [Succinivibrio dextrinosolvens DSM 3072]